jgi:hypothetical protein
VQLSWAYLNQQTRAAAQASNADGQNQPNTVLGRFHWTQMMPTVYSVLLILVSCLLGYFSISGFVFFLLFVLHSAAYYGYRDYNEPIDMLTNIREKNKSTKLRVAFKWSFLVVSCLYFLTLVVGHATAEYTEVKSMMQDEDKERLRRNEIIYERNLNKVIPDCLSYWNFLISFLLLGAAVALFKVQREEEEEAQKVDLACLDVYRDIHFTNNSPLGQALVPQGSPASASLTFKPYQVQKCVSIFKDYKFKAEILLCLQILMLALISNAQYCLYGLPYLALTVVQLLNIAFSHGRSDQDIRATSSWMTNFLLCYLPADLLYHYAIHYYQESQRIDEEYQPSLLDSYQGIMATTPSFVTFGLKIALFIFECVKYKYSYDMGPTYKKLKDAYMDAESSALPSSKLMSGGAEPGEGQPDDHALAAVSPKHGQTKIRFDGNELPGTNQITRQHTLDFQRRQKYNKRLKLQYIKIFKKSTSFVHKIIKPIALFMVCLLQLIFILAHPSVLFVVLLGLSLTGFFVELKEHSE